jgi:hypothetical protein
LRAGERDDDLRGSRVEINEDAETLVVTPVQVRRNYTNFLPSLNVRANLDDKLVGRIAAGHAGQVVLDSGSAQATPHSACLGRSLASLAHLEDACPGSLCAALGLRQGVCKAFVQCRASLLVEQLCSLLGKRLVSESLTLLTLRPQ